ncbi:DEAD/DEAH box helicase [Cellulosimicrobium cellulans]|uniref:DEAD/DEAH box helicase n=1 Tax=Cellulosimicrobium cellulans TaxID=1710 RepID=UPI0036506F6A
MKPPDFTKARRQLRRARIQDALGLERKQDTLRYRNELLEPLFYSATQDRDHLETLTDETVDSIVSVAVTDVNEDPLDTFGVQVTAFETLARDGQFARLAQMARSFAQTCTKLRTRRPLLAVAGLCFSSYVEQDGAAALSAIESVLADPPVAPGSESAPLTDFLAVSTLRSVILRGPGEANLALALKLAAAKGDGHAHSFLRALDAFVYAANNARLASVIASHDPAFGRPELSAYMAQRGNTILFPAQVRAIQAGVTTAPRSVVALPTSSGKTLLAELRVASMLSHNPNGRVIYIAPYRLLARQVEESFTKGLTPLGATVEDVGGIFDATDPDLGGRGVPTVAIMTPERLDSLLRLRGRPEASASMANELFDTCQLVVFDELQLVGRRGRGPRMELLLARLQAAMPDLEFLGLSAASHGADSVARWLTGHDAISGATRPTGTLEIAWATDGKLIQRVGGQRAVVGNLPRTGRPVNDAASLILQLDIRYQPVLAVCVSRPIAESLARRISTTGTGAIAEWWAGLGESERALLEEAVEEVRLILGDRHPLASQLEQGIGVHHAGIPTAVLRRIEALAKRRILRVVCATTTVAEGADLPFKSVVVPHLNFPGRSRKLDRDLYLNLIGRAGRANVSIEGLVFILESDADTLKDHVRRSLWLDSQGDRIESALESLPSNRISSVEDWEYFFEVQSQVMGWLGDGNSYFDDQAGALADISFGAFETRARDRAVVSSLFSSTLRDLEVRGFARASSPFRLTDAGEKARLTGLSAPSVSRLAAFLRDSADEPIFGVGPSTSLISQDEAFAVATLSFQSLESLRRSLWMRRAKGKSLTEFQLLREIAEGAREWPDSSELHADIVLLSSWLAGKPYSEIANLAPRVSRANSLFGGNDLEKLTSDAAEYIGQVTYPALLTWSAAIVLHAESLGRAPSFVRQAIEFGVPSASGVYLVEKIGLTRTGAIVVSEECGPVWSDALRTLRREGPPRQLAGVDVTRFRNFVRASQD